jgi:hypothetical protein
VPSDETKLFRWTSAGASYKTRWMRLPGGVLPAHPSKRTLAKLGKGYGVEIRAPIKKKRRVR